MEKENGRARNVYFLFAISLNFYYLCFCFPYNVLTTLPLFVKLLVHGKCKKKKKGNNGKVSWNCKHWKTLFTQIVKVAIFYSLPLESTRKHAVVMEMKAASVICLPKHEVIVVLGER